MAQDPLCFQMLHLSVETGTLNRFQLVGSMKNNLRLRFPIGKTKEVG